MGLATIDPHSQKEHAEIPRIPSLVLFRLVLTEIQAFKNEKKYKPMYGNADKSGLLSGFVRVSIHLFVIFSRF